MTLELFVVASLATWRITSLLAWERGPFSIGTRIRSLFGIAPDDAGGPMLDIFGGLAFNPVTPWESVDDVLNEIAQGLTCVRCCSVWVAGIVCLFFNFNPFQWVLCSMAVSAMAIGIDKVLG